MLYKIKDLINRKEIEKSKFRDKLSASLIIGFKLVLQNYFLYGSLSRSWINS